MSDPATASSPASPPVGPLLHSARIRCEVCGAETPHRILHLERAGSPSRAAAVRGVARCRSCGFSHSFVSEAPRLEAAWLIISEGTRSERRRINLPADRKLQVGSGVPETDEALVIHKIDDRTGRAVPVARAREVATIWAVRDSGPFVPYSLIEGRITRAGRLTIAPETPLEVGTTVRLPTTSATIVGLRARNHTWRREGDRFPAGEVQRLYARRTVRPPAGNTDWSTARESPRSRESSTSMRARSRSSPGVRTARTAPRARMAGSGAAIHRSSES